MGDTTRKFMVSIIDAPLDDGGDPIPLDELGIIALSDLINQANTLVMERYGHMTQQMNEWRDYARHLEAKWEADS